MPAMTYMKRDKPLTTAESAFICHPMRPAVPTEWGCRHLMRILGVFLQPGLAKRQGFFAGQALLLGGLDILGEHRLHGLGPPRVFFRGELYYLIPFGDGQFQR